MSFKKHCKNENVPANRYIHIKNGTIFISNFIVTSWNCNEIESIQIVTLSVKIELLFLDSWKKKK